MSKNIHLKIINQGQKPRNKHASRVCLFYPFYFKTVTFTINNCVTFKILISNKPLVSNVPV